MRTILPVIALGSAVALGGCESFEPAEAKLVLGTSVSELVLQSRNGWRESSQVDVTIDYEDCVLPIADNSATAKHIINLALNSNGTIDFMEARDEFGARGINCKYIDVRLPDEIAVRDLTAEKVIESINHFLPEPFEVAHGEGSYITMHKKPEAFDTYTATKTIDPFSAYTVNFDSAK